MQRRQLLGLTAAGAAAALGGCALAPRAPSTAAGATPGGRAALPPAGSMQPVQVSAHGYYVQGHSALGSRENRNFIANAGFFITPAGVVLVDALGSPALARELQQAIARITPRPVTHVVLTHYHADHVYGLQVWKQAGARIIAHQRGREYLNAETARLRLQASLDEGLVEPGTRLLEADEWIDGDARLVLGGVPIELLYVGAAHTPDDLAVFVPSERLLYAGDLVFRGRLPFVGEADSRNWIVSLDRLLALPADAIVPGHGPHSTNARTDLQLTRDYLAYLRATMGPAAREMRPFDEAYAATDWSRYAGMPLFDAANRMNAYNTYLLMEREPE